VAKHELQDVVARRKPDAASKQAAQPDLGALLQGALHPSFPRAGADLKGYPPILVAMALLASGTGSLSNLKYASYVHEKGWRTRDAVRRQRIDMAVSVTGMFAMLALAQIAAASVLRPRGVTVKRIEDLIPIFTEAFGDHGQILFGVMLWCMVYSVLIGQNMGQAVMLSDIFHRFLRPDKEESSSERAPSEKPAYRPMVLYQFFLPLLVVFTNWSPVALVLASGVLTSVLTAWVAFLVLRITASTRIMGQYRNGWLSNITLLFTLGLSLLLSYQLAVEALGSFTGSRH